MAKMYSKRGEGGNRVNTVKLKNFTIFLETQIVTYLAVAKKNLCQHLIGQ